MSAANISPLVDVSQLPVTAHQFVYATLRRAILTGALPGGTRLVQADTASQLSVSTTPVREALRDLAAEGLVVIRPHSGAVVRALDTAELTELYDIRKALEPLAVRRAAAEIAPAEITRAQQLIKEMDAEPDAVAFAELDRQFHDVVEAAARAPFISSVLRGVQDIAANQLVRALSQRPARMSAASKEHKALVTALRRHDADAAARIHVAHLDTALKAILQDY